MRTYITHMPTAEHAPVGQMGGTSGEVPVIHLDRAYGNASLQFDPDTPDVTIAYLTTLVAEASKLLEAVKVREARS